MSDSEYELTDYKIRTAFHHTVVVIPMFDKARRGNSSVKRREKKTDFRRNEVNNERYRC